MEAFRKSVRMTEPRRLGKTLRRGFVVAFRGSSGIVYFTVILIRLFLFEVVKIKYCDAVHGKRERQNIVFEEYIPCLRDHIFGESMGVDSV